MGVQLAYNVVRHTPVTTYAEVAARRAISRQFSLGFEAERSRISTFSAGVEAFSRSP